MCALTTRTFKFQKKNGWKMYVASLNRTTPVPNVWDMRNKFAGAQKRMSNQNNVTSTLLPTANAIAAKLAPPYVQDKNETYAYDQQRDNSPTTKQPFTYEELILALDNVKITSPGLDDINYEVYKNLPQEANKTLLDLYNLLWQHNIISSDWRNAKVVPILKHMVNLKIK
jgi:hypothetical protein